MLFMRERKILMIGLILVVLLFSFTITASADDFYSPKESVIVYENQVVSQIDAQLSGIDLEAVRAKEALVLNKSVADIQAAIKDGKLTYTELTAFYLDRIKRFDKAEGGVNAIIAVNPDAIKEAREKDAGENKTDSPVYGMPVLLKDNINTSSRICPAAPNTGRGCWRTPRA